MSRPAGTALVVFQSTPPARGATLYLVHAGHVNRISIHAPREGGDYIVEVMLVIAEHFNPRPPRGGRQPEEVRAAERWVSQSTPPARGATLADRLRQHKADISIHAPREGGDAGRPELQRQEHYFNPRPPRGGRRLPAGRGALEHRISIHAPREGGD